MQDCVEKIIFVLLVVVDYLDFNLIQIFMKCSYFFIEIQKKFFKTSKLLFFNPIK